MRTLLLLLALATAAGAQDHRVDVIGAPGEPLAVIGSAGSDLPTEVTSIAISTTLTAIKARTDLLAEQTTAVAISTTATAIKTRADLLASEATATAISTTATAIKARADLLATEATAAAISTTSTAILARANLLATEATATAISTTATAIKARADLLATEASNIAISTGINLLNQKTSTTPAGGLSVSGSTVAAYQGGTWIVQINAEALISPQTPGSGEAVNSRSFQTTVEVTLGNSGVQGNLLLVVNPSTSTKRVHLHNITFGNTGGASKSTILRVYDAPVVTSSGTAISPTSMYRKTTPAVATTQTFTSPVTSARGTKLSVASQTSEQGEIDYDWGLLLDAGRTLLLTGEGTANNVPMVVNIIWTEVTP